MPFTDDECYQKSFINMAARKYQLFPSPIVANAPSNAIDRKWSGALFFSVAVAANEANDNKMQPL